MNVLMATDGSKDAATAITSAARLLRKEDLQVDVLCVAPQLTLERSSQSTSRGRLHDTYKKKITKESERIVHKAQQVLHREGLNAKTLAKWVHQRTR